MLFRSPRSAPASPRRAGSEEPLGPLPPRNTTLNIDSPGQAGKIGRRSSCRNSIQPKWRNWQTRMVQVHVPARVWGFESLLRHQEALPAVGFRQPRPFWSSRPTALVTTLCDLPAVRRLAHSPGFDRIDTPSSGGDTERLRQPSPQTEASKFHQGIE